MYSRKTKVKSLRSLGSLKSRRTSLNVNLSYTSNFNSLSEDDDEDDDDDRTNAFSLLHKNRLPKTSTNTVIEKTDPPVRWNLSTKNKPVDVKQTPSSTNAIKPSFVKMIRLSSAYISSRNENYVDSQTEKKQFSPSEKTKLSSALENVRFPLTGEILSPDASVIMETSMDLTEVQGAAVVNFDATDSSEVIEDTEIAIDDSERRIKAVVIPDSEQDSVNTIRTSLNVNTSLDSRFSLMPNWSLYDPEKDRGDKIGAVLTNTTSQSSNENLPMNTVVTTAVIENVNLLNNVDDCRVSLNVNTSLDSRFSEMRNKSLYDPKESRKDSLQGVLNCDEIVVRETNVDLENRQEFEPDTQSSSEDYSVNRNEPNKNTSTSVLGLLSESSSTEASATPNPDTRDLNPKTDDVALGVKPIRRGKRRLMTLHGSEMIDLSPVTVTIGREKRAVTKKRCRKLNKTAKKVTRKDVGIVKKSAKVVSSSEDDVEEEDQSQREKKAKTTKRVRKINAKKIVIKKMADVHLWKKITEDNEDLNESTDHISSALGRTSLDDFAPKLNAAKQKDRTKKPKVVIVATGLSIEQKLLVKSTVTALGSAKLEKIVTRNTTHVISKGIRTVNLLRGMVRGCWLVNFEWISKSREAGEWIDAEKFEITSFSKAVQENRKEKQLFGAAYVSELFLACGSIHIKDKTSTPAQVLKELVRIAGGRVTAEPEEAKIIIGRGGLKEVWILDSITSGELQPLDRYCRKKKNPN